MSKNEKNESKNQENLFYTVGELSKISPLSGLELFRLLNKDNLGLDNNVLLSAVSKQDIEIVKEIIDKKNWDLNIKNIKGQTLLHIAIINSDLEMTKFLVENGSDIEKVDYYGQTAIQTAISNNSANVKNQIAIIEFLLTHQPNLHHQDSEYNSLMDLARAQSKNELKEKIMNILEEEYIRAVNIFQPEEKDEIETGVTGKIVDTTTESY